MECDEEFPPEGSVGKGRAAEEDDWSKSKVEEVAVVDGLTTGGASTFFVATDVAADCNGAFPRRAQCSI